jgi:CRISPR/Cas system-associated exonuclease Cas4 (RecB family)
LKIFEVKKDEKIFNQLINRASKLHYYLTKNEVPLPECKIDKSQIWECNYCSYKQLCKEIGDRKHLKEVVNENESLGRNNGSG